MSNMKEAREIYDREFDAAFGKLLEQVSANVAGLQEKYRRKLLELGVDVDGSLPKSADDFYAEELKIEKNEV
jgi:hypothetical protein